MLSPSDTAIVFLLALLLFGPDQLPRIAKQLGEAMRHIQTTTHSFMNEMERAARIEETQSASSVDASLRDVRPPPPPMAPGAVDVAESAESVDDAAAHAGDGEKPAQAGD